MLFMPQLPGVCAPKFTNNGMELRDLRYFTTLAREANLSKAADALGLSQSTLSKSLARLEAACGASLVLRLPRGIEVTEQGQIVLRHAERMTTMAKDVRAAVDASRQVAQDCLRLGVGLGELGEAESLALSQFVSREPHARVDVVQASSEALSAALARGDVDCVIGPTPDVVPPDHRVTPLGTDTYAGVCAINHPRRDRLRSLAALVQERWAVPWATTRVGLRLAGLVHQRGLPLPKVAMRCDAVTTLLSTIARSDCVGCFSHAMVQAHPLRDQLMILSIEEIRYVKSLVFISREHNADLLLVRTIRELVVANRKAVA